MGKRAAVQGRLFALAHTYAASMHHPSRAQVNRLTCQYISVNSIPKAATQDAHRRHADDDAFSAPINVN